MMIAKHDGLSLRGICSEGGSFLLSCTSRGSIDSSDAQNRDQAGLRSPPVVGDSVAAAATSTFGVKQGFYYHAGLKVEHEGIGTPPINFTAVQSKRMIPGSNASMWVNASAPDSCYPTKNVNSRDKPLKPGYLETEPVLSDRLLEPS